MTRDDFHKQCLESRPSVQWDVSTTHPEAVFNYDMSATPLFVWYEDAVDEIRVQLPTHEDRAVAGATVREALDNAHAELVRIADVLRTNPTTVCLDYITDEYAFYKACRAAKVDGHWYNDHEGDPFVMDLHEHGAPFERHNQVASVGWDYERGRYDAWLGSDSGFDASGESIVEVLDKLHERVNKIAEGLKCETY